MVMDIKVPVLGESVTEAMIAGISKGVGESVAEGEVLFELETDKVTLEVSAPADGVISEMLVSVEDNVEINQVLCKLQERSIEKSAAPESIRNRNIELETKKANKAEKILSPAAEKIVQEKDINVQDIQGSGKGGRVMKSDVIDHSVARPAEASCVQQNYVKRQEKPVRMSKLRQRIAERLKQSQSTAAILTTFNEIDMHYVMELRAKYKDSFEKKYGIKLGFMSFFIRAVIQALREIPDVNAEISGNNIVYKNYYDIGVAVGTEQGLVVPIIFNAEQLSMAELEMKIAEFGNKARNCKLTIEELTGGTFTISNGGVYGSLFSTPIINPPQSGILGMHSIQKRPVVIGDRIEIRPMMYVALSYDHRIVDGKDAVTFLVRIKQFIEDPSRLLLEV